MTAKPLTLPSRVIAACEQLGDAASGRKVREVLGGGSLRDITPLVTRWKVRNRVDTRVGRQQTALDAALMRNRLLDRVAHTLTPGNELGRMPAAAVPTPDALRRVWREDVAGLRSDVAKLARELTAVRTDPPVAAIEPRPGRELNAALDHIDTRLTSLEASLEAHASPALAVAEAVHALVDRLDALSSVVERLAGVVTTERTAASVALDQGLGVLASGQEALASTIGFCAQGTLQHVLGALERLDRRQVTRARRSRKSSPTTEPRSPSLTKKMRRHGN